MNRGIAFAALAAVAALGCSAGSPDLDTRTFELQHLEVNAAAQMIDPYVYGDRAGAPGEISGTGNTLTVRETPDNLDKIARVLAEYDRPKPSVQLHFQIIAADGASAPDPAIAEVETELRKLFRFDGYRLITEAVLGGTDGSTVTQRVSGPEGPLEINVEIQQVRGATDSGSVLMKVALWVPEGGGLNTSVNARSGQTVVLGNAQIGSKGGTLILTVRPELVGG